MKNQDKTKTEHNITSKELIEKIEELLKSSEDKNIDLVFALIKEQGIQPKQVPYVEEMLTLNDWLNSYDKGFSGEVIEVIEGLIALKRLDLNNNQLTKLPQSIGNLTVLERLYLHNNQLTEMPQSIGNLSALNSLNLWNNQLTELLKSIGNLTALEWLNLLNNQLKQSIIKSVKTALPRCTVTV